MSPRAGEYRKERTSLMIDETLVALVDEIDALGGARLLKAKRYSIDQLRKDGYSDEQIEALLNVKL